MEKQMETLDLLVDLTYMAKSNLLTTLNKVEVKLRSAEIYTGHIPQHNEEFFSKAGDYVLDAFIYFNPINDNSFKFEDNHVNAIYEKIKHNYGLLK